MNNLSIIFFTVLLALPSSLTPVAHYSQKGDYQLLEKCFLQILPQCLDIHQVCRAL